MNKKIFIIMMILISMLTGCEKERVSMELSEEKSGTAVPDTSVENNGTVYIFISGQVKKPGVYQFQEPPRIFEVIQKAGGLTKKAQENCLNQAEQVSDGQSIYVMSKKEYQASQEQKENGKSSGESLQEASGKINLNEATEQELMTLPGIGTTKAKAIIEYREINGRFTKVEDLKKVSGIGDATFSNLESMIAVD